MRSLAGFVNRFDCIFKRLFRTTFHAFFVPDLPKFARTPISSEIPNKTNSVFDLFSCSSMVCFGFLKEIFSKNLASPFRF